MALNFTQTARHTGTLNHSLVQAIAVMRMSRIELQEHLAAAAESNPFVQPERPRPASGGGGSGDRDLGDVAARTEPSLYQHVGEQIAFAFDNPYCAALAQAFLRELEPSGWLGKSPEHIAAELGVPPGDCMDILYRLQALEPAGLFARDLRECLRLQASERGELDALMLALLRDLDAVAELSPEQLARRFHCTPADIAERLRLIRRLDPKPGSRFDTEQPVLRDSDVLVVVRGQDLIIELNSASFPTLRRVAPLDTGKVAPEHRDGLRNLVAEARALRNACALRRATSLALVSALFARQRRFLSRGYAALVPMRMGDVADDIGVSEATVSRILNGLSLQCAQGTIPARSLFCAPVSRGTGDQTKHVAFGRIRSLIAAEPADAPLSDGNIATELQRSGFTVSRRTVAKYRQELGLDAPADRRRRARVAAHLVSAPARAPE